MSDHIEALRQLIAERDSLNSRNMPDGPWQDKRMQESMSYVPRCAKFILEHGDAVLAALATQSAQAPEKMELLRKADALAGCVLATDAYSRQELCIFAGNFRDEVAKVIGRPPLLDIDSDEPSDAMMAKIASVVDQDHMADRADEVAAFLIRWADDCETCEHPIHGGPCVLIPDECTGDFYDIMKEAAGIALRVDYPEAAMVCAEAYQVVGDLLDRAGLFDSPQGVKILDNLSQHRLVHKDVLPWGCFDVSTQHVSHPQPVTPAVQVTKECENYIGHGVTLDTEKPCNYCNGTGIERKPVTPAGGEVARHVAWLNVIADEEEARPDLYRQPWKIKACEAAIAALRTSHPPAADAALVRDGGDWTILSDLSVLVDAYGSAVDGRGVVSLMDQLRRMARDAERYRWLRDNRRAAIPELQAGWDVVQYRNGGEDESITGGQTLDAAIDAAMQDAALNQRGG